jgi:hypothetical protein
MIQHAGEAQYADHASDESILAFDPEGLSFLIAAPLVGRFYAAKFKGRPTLGN